MNFFDRIKRFLGDRQAPGTEDLEEGRRRGETRAISCAEALERVQEYLDGELDGVPHQEVANHFAVCQRCYPHLRLEQHFRDLLRRSREGEACPESLRRKILETLAAESRGRD